MRAGFRAQPFAQAAMSVLARVVLERRFPDMRPGLRSAEWCSQRGGGQATVRVDDLVRNQESRSRSSLGGFAARLVAQRGLVGGAQLIARTRCVRVGTRDAEVELAQFVDHRRHELRAPVAKQFGADA